MASSAAVPCARRARGAGGLLQRRVQRLAALLGARERRCRWVHRVDHRLVADPGAAELADRLEAGRRARGERPQVQGGLVPAGAPKLAEPHAEERPARAAGGHARATEHRERAPRRQRTGALQGALDRRQQVAAEVAVAAATVEVVERGPLLRERRDEGADPGPSPVAVDHGYQRRPGVSTGASHSSRISA